MKEMIRLLLNQRFRKVVSLFAKFTFQFWWLAKIKPFLSAEESAQRYKALYSRQGQEFTDTAVHLGGLLIKLGQFFSSRVDILPKEYTDILSTLQDSVKPVETKEIVKIIESELAGSLENIFVDLSSTPLAAASFGQVYKAKLLSGQIVAVKVLRPGIEAIVDIDLHALKLVLNFAKRNSKINAFVDLDLVYKEFKETVEDELNYLTEGKNADLFRENFANEKDIYVPEIYWQYSTPKVLTMEYINAIKINDFTKLEGAGINKEQLAGSFFATYLKQLLIDGFFHADPHPGNILVKNDGTLVFLDFGMVGHIPPDMKENIVDLAMSIVKKDADLIVDAFYKLGFLRPNADRSTLIKSVQLMISNTAGNTDIKNINIEELSIEIRELMYSEPFQLPAKTTFLGKALITVLGICNSLDKNFDIVKSANPYLKLLFNNESEFSGKNLLIDGIKKELGKALSLPDKVNHLVNGLESGDIKLQPSKVFEQRLLEHQNYNTTRIIKSVLSSGFLISGTQLINGNQNETGFVLIGISLLFLISLLAGNRNTGGSRTSRYNNRKMKPRFHP